MTCKSKDFEFKALTDLWTGSVDQKPTLLKNTGLLGSIRWWLEVLVRGLDGPACDPSNTKCGDEKHCVVCELFGCTGWARKFRFDVLDEHHQLNIHQIKRDDRFYFRFTELRPIRPEEWAILSATLGLIADYGAIGGKTVLKPTDEKNSLSKDHHKDFGLIELVTTPQLPIIDRKTLTAYVGRPQWGTVTDYGFAWASLKNFWFIDEKYLYRKDIDKSSFNKVVGRQESKRFKKTDGSQKHRERISASLTPPFNINKWLAGKQGESKKVFSFKAPPRTFGFVKPKLITFEEIKKRLKEVFDTDEDFIKGPDILNNLLSKERPL